MANDNAVIYYESGQSAQPLEAMTTKDQQNYSASFKPFSAKSGFEAMIAPNGVVNGGALSASATANTVSVASVLVSLATATGANAMGQLTVAGADVLCARPTTSDFLIHSITVNSAGALVTVKGTEGTAFSEARNVAGSAPYIPVGSVEIGQVRYSAKTSAVLTIANILQVPGLHVELADFPVYSINEAEGKIEFASALPLIHTGDLPKGVNISGFTPVFAEVPKGYDWKPSETTHSVSSQQVYGATIGSTSSSLGQGGFSAILKDGITDNIMKVVDESIWVKFKQDRNRVPYQLTQGKLGVARSFPADGGVTAAFTLSSEAKSSDYSL
jgi:hypothetical protein